MNMKKKLLASAVIALLSSAVFADDVDDTQEVTITVPEVALLAVNETAAASFACTIAEDAAGTNFTCAGTNASAVPYAITANRAADASGESRKITAVLGATLSTTWDFQVNAAAATGGGTTEGAVSVLGTTAVDVVTAIDNVAASDGAITYTLAPTDSDVAMEYSDATTGAVVVTFTLSDDA